MDFLSAFDFSKGLSLYIHIPFCTSKCSYCAFYSKPGTTELLREAYVEKLVRQIDAVTEQMKGPFYTAFIGGGNPGCLTTGQLERICMAVCRKGRPVEFTTEMNPESLTTGMFPLFENYLTRISMGVQSLSEEALKFLGRNAGIKETLDGMKLALLLKKETGCRVNFDLITCLGKFHDAFEDVKAVAEDYDPDHISLYALTLEEGTPLYRKNPPVPSSEEQYDILMPLWQYLEGKGYNHYEVSNFAKKDCMSLHNNVYWDYKPYLGLGCAAASTAFKGKDAVRFCFNNDVNRYVEGGLWDGFEAEILDQKAQLEEFVLMGLRHKKGLDLSRLKKDFGKDLPFVPEGYEIKGGFLVPSDDGFMIADSAAANILDTYF